MELMVRLGEKSYPIYIEKGLLKRAGSCIKEIYRGRKVMIVSDDRVYGYYGESLKENLSSAYECHVVTVRHGEASKSFETLPELYSAFLKAGITRSDLIIALGGGVVGDLAGFAAATYLRGIKFVQIPTSLLAQVDSSVGGKVAVDLPQGKNLVGAFYHPRLVLIDPEVLDTLPERYISDGMGEVIKYGCIKDAGLFEKLKRHQSFHELKEDLEELIYLCVDIKREVVEKDQYDFGERMLLNFGHTLAHSIEQYFHYDRESHGEAVAIGMYQITKLAEKQGLTAEGTAEEIREVLVNYGLPYECRTDMEELLPGIARDKKNIEEKLNLVLLKKIGESYVYPSSSEFFDNAGRI